MLVSSESWYLTLVSIEPSLNIGTGCPISRADIQMVMPRVYNWQHWNTCGSYNARSCSKWQWIASVTFICDFDTLYYIYFLVV